VIGHFKLAAALVLIAAPALACEYPDEGNMPLRRAVAKVRYLPQTEAWAQSMHEAGAVVHYALHLDAAVRIRGRCYWPVEVRAGNRSWRRFYVTPDAEQVLEK
jgi:hypothetical protein